ncbi:hypothetical protein AB1207_20415 [Kineococcus endophyticus]|uniref:Uncharacterized protein n=1 Tax=Kineococcus endophyticus TaxID=1181883 RepID=A0ABV3PCC0_9ACTN
MPFTVGRWAGEVRRGGSLSHLTHDGVPVLRAVRGVVRDRDWRTAPATVTSTSATSGALLLAGTFDDDGGEDVVHGDWTLDARDDDGRLAVEFRATARTAFRRNRCGLVVLHRPDDAGRPLTVRHPDGTTTSTGFPVEIAPHQPARDVAGLAWSRPGVDVDLEFSGDVFEVEDQRNWTDASFKTYSTPLERPFPVPVAAGATVVHRVVVSARPTGSSREPGPPPGPVRWRETGTPLPRWGTDRPVEGFAGTLLVELLLDDPAWPDHLARARAAGNPLDVRLVTDDPDLLPDAVAALWDARVERLGVHSLTRHVSTRVLWAALSAAAGDLPLVAGSRAHFTELNRTVAQLPPDATGVVFGSTPQMHDTGRDQFVEAVDVLRLTARQAVRIAAGRPVHVGPVSVVPRFNAVATTPARLGRGDPSVGSGPSGPVVTAWCVAAAAACSVDGVASVVLGASRAGGEAVAEAVRLLAPFAGRPRLDTDGVLPQGVHVLAAGTLDRGSALVANLAEVAHHVDLGGRPVDVPPAGVRPCGWGAAPEGPR